ncbi:hypothetical protein ACSQX3_002258 [Enterobacter hormaechei]|uniref:hypothetical protein n=1 Tax=Enterobacter hormaechei TaxID=158836 RepID=UPI002FEE6A16
MSDLVKRGHDQVAELKSSCGAVDVRDVAQLISDLATQLDVQLARSNALAAENAGLKKVPATDSETMLLALDAFNTHGSTRPDAGLKQAINFVMQRRQTPATDAFLAEVRAQGVEMVIAYHRERADALHHVDRNNAIRHSMAALDASDVAAQLRQVAAQ